MGTKIQQCKGKVRHESRQDAEAHKRRLIESSGGFKVNVYKCKFCKGFHVGNEKAQYGRRRRKR